MGSSADRCSWGTAWAGSSPSPPRRIEDGWRWKFDRQIFAQFASGVRSVALPEAGHHAMLDEPLILLTAICTLLADWDHSEPHVR